MAVGQIIGGIAALGGAGLSAYGANRRGLAMRDANAAYEDALNREDARRRGATLLDIQRSGEFAEQDRTAREGAVRGLLAAPDVSATDVNAYRANVVNPVMEQARSMAPAGGGDSSPQAAWAQRASAALAPALNLSVNDQARAAQDRQRAQMQDAQMTDLALKRLVARRAVADWRERQEIDRMIAELSWARQQRQLQARMNQASTTGADQMAFGNLMTQVGGSMIGMGGKSGQDAQQPGAAPTLSDPYRDETGGRASMVRPAGGDTYA